MSLIFTPAPGTVSTPPSQDFDVALDDFLYAAQQQINAHYAANYPNLTPNVLSAEPGRKYIRIVSRDSTAVRGYVYCFVRKADGAILKAAGWKAPAKGVRGSIYSAQHGLEGVTPYGARYLR